MHRRKGDEFGPSFSIRIASNGSDEVCAASFRHEPADGRLSPLMIIGGSVLLMPLLDRVFFHSLEE